MRKNWTRTELILAMNLYCKLPFGKFDKVNSQVIELSNILERTPSAVAMKLSNLASLDPFHAERGVKGLSGASKGDRAVWQEFHSDWKTLAAESEILLSQMISNKDEADSTTQKVYEGETESLRLTKVRLAQQFFRKSVLASYEMRCCITQISIPTLLVASHILPWSRYPNERVNPQNGLCLNSLFDKAFDQGLITFDNELKLVLSEQLRDAEPQISIKQHFSHYEGKQLRKPTKFASIEKFLSIHRDKIFIP
jgi:predicted restriction endonuclease